MAVFGYRQDHRRAAMGERACLGELVYGWVYGTGSGIVELCSVLSIPRTRWRTRPVLIQLEWMEADDIKNRYLPFDARTQG